MRPGTAAGLLAQAHVILHRLYPVHFLGHDDGALSLLGRLDEPAELYDSVVRCHVNLKRRLTRNCADRMPTA
jgi:hypothetical protein